MTGDKETESSGRHIHVDEWQCLPREFFTRFLVNPVYLQADGTLFAYVYLEQLDDDTREHIASELKSGFGVDAVTLAWLADGPIQANTGYTNLPVLHQKIALAFGAVLDEEPEE